MSELSCNAGYMSSLSWQRECLRVTGNQFEESERRARWIAIPDVYLASEDEGYMQVIIDGGVVPGIPRMIVPDEQLYRELRDLRPNRHTVRNAHAWTERLMNSEGVILGFSGYGTGGLSYENEHEAVGRFFDAFEVQDYRVGHVIDGGGGFGVPGVAATAARWRGYETTAISTVQGLRGIGPHDNVVVATGDTLPEYGRAVNGGFGTEAAALGVAPDVLVVLGGGPIAQLEIAAAMGNATDIIFAPGINKNYPDNSAVYAYRDPDSLQANANGPMDTRIHIVEAIDDIPGVIAQLDSSSERIRRSRQIRSARLLAELK